MIVDFGTRGQEGSILPLIAYVGAALWRYDDRSIHGHQEGYHYIRPGGSVEGQQPDCLNSSSNQVAIAQKKSRNQKFDFEERGYFEVTKEKSSRNIIV